MKPIFKISIPNTHRDYFDYYADTVEPCIGARVWVPFRKQQRLGIVLAKEFVSESYASTKTILEVIDQKPLLSGDILALCQWISRYYQSPLSEVIPLALPKKYRLGDDSAPPSIKTYHLAMPIEWAHEQISTRSPKQHALIDCLATHLAPVSKKWILEAGFSQAQLQALVDKGILEAQLAPQKPIPRDQAPSEPLALNAEQAMAVNTISAHLSSYHCFLLQGVTGSGKTEVYLQVIAKVLAAGLQVLVLVPEIGLTPQLLARFQDRFKEPMVVIHSHLNDTERQLAWLWAKEEAVKLVIGTRAAIFTPMPALGLIVIDEEHDLSLKQMEGVRYSARDTALMRAHLRHIPIILGSATPSLETLHNCALNKYRRLCLSHKALNSTPLRYQILDIRHQLLQHGLADATLSLIREHLEQNNQVLVFINRRGFSPVLLCHQCGWMADCRACDAHLTVHKNLGRLICHHCGLSQRMPTHCGQCQSHDLLPIGAGTQRVHEYLSTQFPSVSVVRIDRDEVRQKDALDQSLARIQDGDAQLIVGTQMLAKGHHFPRLTLVVVLEADQGFYNQDFRALERLGQLLTQVAGRAGRAEFPGHVLIQTHVPQHPLLNLLIQQGYDAFAQSLLTSRQQAELPPYSFMAVIRAQGKGLPALLQALHAMKEQLQTHKMHVLGPAPAPLARKGGLHRMQLMVKSPSRKHLGFALTQLREWLTINKIVNGIRWNVDVDPMDLS
jgi:primosomal protein N' (replication factor Y)